MPDITCQHKDNTLGHSMKRPSKRNRHIYVVLLHRELYLHLNRQIRQGRALTGIGLWRRVHKIPTGVSQKAECLGKPWSFVKRIGIEIRILKHVGFRISAPFEVVLTECVTPCRVSAPAGGTSAGSVMAQTPARGPGPAGAAASRAPGTPPRTAATTRTSCWRGTSAATRSNRRSRAAATRSRRTRVSMTS